MLKKSTKKHLASKKKCSKRKKVLEFHFKCRYGNSAQYITTIDNQYTNFVHEICFNNNFLMQIKRSENNNALFIFI